MKTSLVCELGVFCCLNFLHRGEARLQAACLTSSAPQMWAPAEKQWQHDFVGNYACSCQQVLLAVGMAASEACWQRLTHKLAALIIHRQVYARPVCLPASGCDHFDCLQVLLHCPHCLAKSPQTVQDHSAAAATSYCRLAESFDR